MPLKIVQSRRFKKAYKRISRRRNFRRDIFMHVVNELSLNRPLEIKHHDHALSGNLGGYRECHLSPDVLLIYDINQEILALTLIDIGNHAQLFK